MHSNASSSNPERAPRRGAVVRSKSVALARDTADSHRFGTIGLATLLGLIGLAMLVAAGPAAAQSLQIGTDNEAGMSRGEYLVTAADCMSCHTGDEAQPFAGGLPVVSPFGTLYSANITPDPEHGIGEYSLEDFTRALQEGINRDGEHMYPACPYTAYTQIQDQDIPPMYEYIMDGVEPAANAVQEHELAFPANVRLGLAAWKEIALDPVRFEADPEQSELYNRGAYLTEALAHCQSCHSPRTATQAIDDDRAYTGAIVGGWYAPNISSGEYSEIAEWSEDELATYLKEGSNNSNVAVIGKMAEVVHDSLAELDDGDVQAIAHYIKNLPPPEEEPEIEEASLSQSDMESGRALYAQNCLGCHQAGGGGVDGGAPALVDNPSVEGAEPNNLVLILLQGHSPEHGWAAMPSYAETFTDREISLVTNYIRTAWGNEGEPNATGELVAELREVAELPEGGQNAGIDCPVLEQAKLEPVLDVPQERFDEATRDREVMEELVATYQEGVDDSSQADVIQSLSAVYCRQLSTDESVSESERNAILGSFANGVAEALVASDERLRRDEG